MIPDWNEDEEPTRPSSPHALNARLASGVQHKKPDGRYAFIEEEREDAKTTRRPLRR